MIAFTLLALFALTGVQSAIEFTYKCPDNYTPYKNECHQLFETKVTWEAAKTECEKHDAYLARIKDADENKHLSDKFKNYEFWIGLNDQATPKTYVYSPAPETSYTYVNWYFLAFSYNGDCVAVKTNGKFDLRKCNDDGNKYSYVCEKDAIKTLECPEGYKFNDKDKEKIDACYKPSVEGVKANYTTANETCVTEGAHLYFPETKAERDYVNGLVNRTEHWIGITDKKEEGKYLTSLGKKVEYKCWCPSYIFLFPWIKKDDDCVVMDFRWFEYMSCFSNRNCDQEHGYVCKMI